MNQYYTDDDGRHVWPLEYESPANEEAATIARKKRQSALATMWIALLVSGSCFYSLWSYKSPKYERYTERFDILGPWAVNPLPLPDELAISQLRALSGIARSDLPECVSSRAILVREGAPEIRHADTELRAFQATHGDHYGSWTVPFPSTDVNLIAYSPDGTRVAILFYDTSIRIYNAETFLEERELQKSEGKVDDLQWSPDGLQLLARIGHSSIHIWSGPALRPTAKFEGPPHFWNAVSWNPSASRVAVTNGHSLCTVSQYGGLMEPDVLREIHGVEQAVWSPDGEKLALAMRNATIRIVVDAGMGDYTEYAEPDWLSGSLTWSPDGSMIVTRSRSGEVKVRRLDTESIALLVPLDMADARFLAWSPEGGRLAVSSSDGPVQIWDLDFPWEPIVLTMAPVSKGMMRGMSWSPDGKWLAVDFGGSGYVCAVRADRSYRVIPLENLVDRGMRLAWTHEGSRLLLVPLVGPVRLWNLEVPAEPVVLRSSDHPVVHAVWSPDGKQIAAGHLSGGIRIVSRDGRSNRMVLARHEAEIGSLCWSPDGSRVFALLENGELWIHSATDGQAPVVLKHAKHPIATAQWSPNGTQIATTAKDKTAALWRIEEPQKPHLWLRHRAIVNRASWNPAGDRIATGLADGTARIWRADGSEAPLELETHKRPIQWLGWSPEGRRLATGDNGGSLRVWLANWGGEMQLREDVRSGVLSAQWNHDGTRLVLLLTNGEPQLVDAGAVPPESKAEFLARAPTEERVSQAYRRGRHPRESGEDFQGFQTDSLGGFKGKLNSASLSPDGRYLLGVSDAGGVHIWHLDRLTEPTLLHESESIFASATWSPDGSRILTVSKDGELRVWLFSWNLLRERLWELLPGGLTHEDRMHLMGESQEVARANVFRRKRERRLREQAQSGSR